MIQMQSILEVADNSGAKSLLTITVLGQAKRIARVGDIVSCAVETALPDGTVKRRQRRPGQDYRCPGRTSYCSSAVPQDRQSEQKVHCAR